MKVRSRLGSPIIFETTIGIAISILEEDRDRDRDLNFGDRAHALDMSADDLFRTSCSDAGDFL